jgi:hypothetical protein
MTRTRPEALLDIRTANILVERKTLIFGSSWFAD